MTVTEVQKNEYNEFYQRYLDKIPQDQKLRIGFSVAKEKVITFFNSIPEEKTHQGYETGKWSIKEVLQHLIDSERVFMYRCFRIARRDDTLLAGFDQNIYNDPAGANEKSLAELIAEFSTVRNSSIMFLNSVTDQDLQFIGNANGAANSARAAAFTVLGHELWHMDVIKERYL